MEEISEFNENEIPLLAQKLQSSKGTYLNQELGAPLLCLAKLIYYTLGLCSLEKYCCFLWLIPKIVLIHQYDNCEIYTAQGIWNGMEWTNQTIFEPISEWNSRLHQSTKPTKPEQTILD